MKWLVGVDEVGRGPLAGPVVVGAACVPQGFDWTRLPGVHDSKKLSERKREAIYAQAKQLQKMRALTFAVAKVSAAVIDKKGITYAVSLGIARSLARLSCDPNEVFVKLDGLLKAPAHYAHQKTIIKGDEREKEIALASIIAKVTRDRYMVNMAQMYTAYGFEKHKGYGTKMHCASIVEHGTCSFHRKSYCTSFIKK